MANQLPAGTLEQHQHEVCNAFARAAVAMRDAASTAENFSNWFSRVNNLQNIPVPPTFNGGTFNFIPNFGSPQHQFPAAQQTSPEQTGKKRKAIEDSDGKKKRRERKPKDANAPRRPPSPYLLFQNEVRKSVQDQHPDIPYAKVLSEIAKLWKGMSLEQREPYRASQAVLKAKYEQEKINYETNPLNPAVVSAPAGAAATAPAPANEKAAAPVVSKSAAAMPSDASDDTSSDESTESSSASDEEEEEEVEENAKPEPEPPRKKSKKEVAKVITPPPVKMDKKEKSAEGKKKRKTADS